MRKIDHFFKRKRASCSQDDYDDAQTFLPLAADLAATSNIEALISENPSPEPPPPSENPPGPLPSGPSRFQKIGSNEIDISSLERDPGLRKQICDYHVNERDQIRRAYIRFGPYQPIQNSYPKSGPEHHRRSFQSTWFKVFPSWLEYSSSMDAAFCLPCFLFNNPSSSRYSGKNAFTVGGFDNWKKVKDGKNCAFLNHEGKHVNSIHNLAERSCEDLMNQSQHIQRMVGNFTSEQIKNNQFRLKVSIDIVRWLTFQGCAFRGRDESLSSINRGNFLEMLSFLCPYNEKVADVVGKAPKNASYTSSMIQKEILHVYSIRVKNAIREEIGDGKYSVIVDEARDESKREQMSIVLRFVDGDGFVRERFFGLVHVSDTKALTLKHALYSALSYHNLDIQNIRGQGYDGASNMRGEFNGLQSLILGDCLYAYYVHCFAHRLQLALVASSKEVVFINQFFVKLVSIVNIVGASCKRHDQLQAAQASDIAYMISIDELESGRGLNQIGTLQRAGDTRWSSHLRSISSLIKLFSATCQVLLTIIDDNGATSTQKGDADTAYETLISFEFVFTLHLMKSIMERTDLLCQALQRQDQDIVNAVQLVSSTKALLQKFRDDKWNDLLVEVKSFCEARNIDVPNMSARYVARKGRARHPPDDITIEQHYRRNFFYEAIDSQLQELNDRFSEHAMELLILSSAINPQDSSRSFRVDDICLLVDKFYPHDFSEFDKMQLRIQLQHYEHNVVLHLEYKKLPSILELCQWLVRTKRSTTYHLVYRVITLVLTLPISTATTERSFSVMNIVKTRLRNKMNDEFLEDSLIVNIEKEIAKTISTTTLMEDFRDLKERRVPL
ncbi:zinc finger MYM-type protein 1-like [Iris pallida]|uniref:Zinc finger MYM-type protein 1-like n=1 Tax=Iris pallida TaxID=29817 RepID=A0AAX6F5F3_IRIPA|nr:zinc finger MYM-type protein 1-like [Iris pallida]